MDIFRGHYSVYSEKVNTQRELSKFGWTVAGEDIQWPKNKQTKKLSRRHRLRRAPGYKLTSNQNSSTQTNGSGVSENVSRWSPGPAGSVERYS